MRFATLALALAACSESGSLGTSPGDLNLVEDSGGFCDNNQPWCGHDLTFDHTNQSVRIESRSVPATAFGGLTESGIAEMAALVGDLPVGSPDDLSTTCADAPIIKLHIAFDVGGNRTYQFSCEPGVFAPLGNFAALVAQALISGQGNQFVVVAVPETPF
jgi:hypothetical protein